MKRISAFLSVCVIILTSMMSCTVDEADESAQIDKVSRKIEISDDVAKRFSDYLDSVGMCEGLSQYELKKKMKQCSYNGTSVSEMVVMLYYDSQVGGGLDATGELVSYYNDYRETEDGYANYSNRIDIKVQLDGLDMPNGVMFGDSVEDTLNKCGISLSIESDAVSGKENITLYSDENTVVQLDLQHANLEYGYSLKYESSFKSAYRDGNVTRYIIMCFDKDNKLASLSMSVKQKYKLKSDNSQDESSNDEQDVEPEFKGFYVISGDQEIIPHNCLIWSRIDNGDGTFVETVVDKYSVLDLINGKTTISVTSIPTVYLDESITYRVQANGKIENTHLWTKEENGYTKQVITFEDISSLNKGVYFVSAEVLLSGNCDPDAPQNSYRYEDVFRLVVEE